ncbi:lipopolysaccharide biosynthesis protein [Haloarchaeobius sp. HRN-SO-5]|uniref:lipopolysaccharide biosynthesis protein n=1 Tax=Haloarchaeobius sp. HRN-SO-5 TaxID=3446118 RepID=UPI003EBB144C
MILRSVQRALTPGSSVAERAVTGGVWVVLLNVVDRLIRFGALIVLARFLSPAAFGLLGLGLLVLAVVRQSTKLGLNAALVHHEDDDVDHYLDTTWVLTVTRGLLIALAAFVSAPYVASLFDAPQLTDVVRVVALTPLLKGLRNPGVVYFKKELLFHKQFGYQISGTVAYAVATVGVALVSPTVWALVAGTLAGAAVRTTSSYAIHPYRPRFRFDLSAARRLLGYGKWIFGSGLVLLALNWGDDGMIGWYVGAASLGLYRLAFQFSNAPATEVTQVISSVAFPAYSQIQDDTAALREAFLRTMRVVSFVSFPVAVGIAAVAPVFVDAFFGPEWLPMVDVIRVLAVWGAFRSIAAGIGPLFRATGRPQYNTALQSLRLVVFAAAVYPATAAWGIVGTAIAIVVSALVENPIAIYVSIRAVDTSVRRVGRLLAIPASASLAMGVVVVSVQTVGTGLGEYAELAVLVATGVVVYGTLVFCWSRLTDLELESDLATLQRALT